MGRMSDLRERLATLGVLPASAGEGALPEAPTDAAAREARARILADAIPGATVVARREGYLVVVERELPADPRGGDVPAAALAGPVSEALARLSGDPRAAGLPLEGAVCLDVETTGLGFGAGTYAFLVGTLGPVGGGGKGALRLWQGLIADPADEPALLARAAEVLEAAPLLLTFNGRRFDVPLLHGRHVLHRLDFGLLEARHLDLLGPARRLYRHRLGSCALARLQAHVLGLPREGDVPGAEIPELYRAFLAHGGAATAPLAAVARHNAEDLSALRGLALRIGRALDPSELREPVHGADWLGLARCRRLLGDAEGALRDGRIAWERLSREAATPDDAAGAAGPGSAPIAPDHPALLPRRGGGATQTALDLGSEGGPGIAPPGAEEPRAAQLHALAGLAGLEVAAGIRRRGDPEAAAGVYEALRAAGQGDIVPFVALAKIAEHGRKDPAAALALVEEALALLRGGGFPLIRRRAEALHDLRHRRDRLLRRLGRTPDPGCPTRRARP